MDVFTKHSEDAIKFIEHCKDLQQTHLKLSELLTQDILTLDGMSFDDKDKPLRKEWINFIQNLLETLDRISLPEK